MAAAFIALQTDDLFYSGGTVAHLVDIPEFSRLLTPAALILYTDVNIQLGEVLQFFLTFDDVAKFIHFGKGTGALVVNGLMFSDCTGGIPGLPVFLEGVFAQLRGKKVTILVGGTAFTCAMSSASVNITAEPDTMAQFQLVFTIVHHNL